MATATATMTGPDANGVVIVEWTLTDTNLDGAAVELAHMPDKTVHSDGNYGSGASVALQGSNNNVAWFALTDPQGDAIAMTADTVGALVAQNPRYIRPLNDGGGDSNTAIVVTLVAAPRRA